MNRPRFCDDPAPEAYRKRETDRSYARPLLTVMGVSGSGKSTVGAALAHRLEVTFADGDDLHPPTNIEKMTAGIPLDDVDRHLWLEAIGAWLAAHDADGGVISCSALKRSYRDQLRGHAPRVSFVHLAGTRDVVAGRLAGRPGHFMPAKLLDSQFAALEALADDEAGLVIDIDQSVDAIIEKYPGGDQC